MNKIQGKQKPLFEHANLLNILVLKEFSVSGQQLFKEVQFCKKQSQSAEDTIKPVMLSGQSRAVFSKGLTDW